jgi:hypothetical protein
MWCRTFINTSVSIFFYYHPTMTKALFELFNCVEVAPVCAHCTAAPAVDGDNFFDFFVCFFFCFF